MTEDKTNLINRRLRTPRAAALAGIVFALLMIVSLVLIRLSVPESLDDSGEWIVDQAERISFAVSLFPFAGIAFLWFLGVIRDRLGEFEDRFFSTVFFGSGLLYMAMSFVSSAIAASLISIYATDPSVLPQTPTYTFNRVLIYQVTNTYSLRMAGIFMTSLGTIWIRTKIMPRILVILTFGLAFIQLFGINLSQWFSLAFPSWVLLISVAILVFNLRKKKATSADSLSEQSSPAEKTLLD
jgi:hypothetical protein